MLFEAILKFLKSRRVDESSKKESVIELRQMGRPRDEFPFCFELHADLECHSFLQRH
jgi:hypothetical protein